MPKASSISSINMTSLNLCAKSLLKAQFALKFGDVMTSLNFCAKYLLKTQFALNFGDVMTSLNLCAKS